MGTFEVQFNVMVSGFTFIKITEFKINMYFSFRNIFI